MIKLNWLVLFLLFSFAAMPAFARQIETDARGTLKNPIIDSRMSKKEAFDGLDPNCPVDLRKRQRIVKVKYYSFDRKIHQGKIVIDKDLVKDIKVVFKAALQERFPINSVIPISDKRFRKDGRWDDDLSMIANNTSAFNYRLKTGGTTLSNHATGRAIDINTVQNPYIKGKILLPPNGKYNPQAEGTLTADSPITKTFLRLGWTWGGSWTLPSATDYQHFEKPSKTSAPILK